MKRYKVVAPVAIITQDTITGPMRMHLYSGTPIGPGMTEKERQHHLDSGMIEEIPSDEPAAPAAEEQVDDADADRTVGESGLGERAGATQEPSSGSDDEQDSNGGEPPSEDVGGTVKPAELDAAREAARAKLPEDGSAPDGRAGKQVWVEYAVSKGYDRAVVEASDRDEIKNLFK